jgi:molybdopterin-guanine dinucleotide biosynthesis protein MobB
VVKHAAHGFQLDREGTDSDRAARAGAVAVVLVGDEEVALRAFPPEAGTVEQAVGLCCGGVPGRVPDVVLVEGFRHPPQRTVVVGTAKEPQGERPWCHLPAWGEIPPASREALLDDLGARLTRLAREGQ